MSLSQRAILVSFSVRCWPGVITQRIVEENNLNPARDKIMHAVVPKKCIEQLRMHGEVMRRMHNSSTVPWNDNGLRLLPSQNLMDYSNKMRKARDEYDSAVEDQLNRLIEVMDEPKLSRDNLRDKFGTSLNFHGVPDENLPVLASIVEASLRDDIVKSINATNLESSKGARRNLVEQLLSRAKRLDKITESEEWEKLASKRDEMAWLIMSLKCIDPAFVYDEQLRWSTPNIQYLEQYLEDLNGSR